MRLLFVSVFLSGLFWQQGRTAVLQRPQAASNSLAFAWGSAPILVDDTSDTASRVIYQNVNSEHVLKPLLSIFSDPSTPADSQAALVYIGHKLRLEDLSASNLASAIEPLQRALESAPYSVSMPAFHTQAAQPLEQSIISYLEGKVQSLQTAGACLDALPDSSSSPAQAVQKLRSSSTAGAKVLLVCGQADADLSSEVSSVSQYSQALQDAFGMHITAYVSEAPAQELELAGASRALLQHMELPAEASGLQLPSYAALTQASDEYLCDDKCFTQVRVIEVVILFITLATALLSGVCMMNVLGTPTKFETTKEIRHQDS